MPSSHVGRREIVIAAILLAGCTYPIPRSDSSSPALPTASAFQSENPANAGASIQPYVPQTTLALSSPVPIPQEVDPPSDLVAIAQAIAESVNKLRVAMGEEPLAVDDRLTRIAFARSADMVVRGYFSHDDPQSSRNLALWLLTDAGYRGKLGENLFATQAPLEDVVDETINGWLRSETHRANAMDAGFHLTGVGLLSDGEWWKVTQVFAEQAP